MWNNFDDLVNSGKKFKVIYADPPWTFSSWSEKGEGKSAQTHYHCMTMEDIENLPVSSISMDDSILFMWTTSPLMPKQIQCLEKWGFTYKTFGFTWVKTNPKSGTPFIGLGYYTRSNPEYLLIGTKGKPGRPKNKSVSSVIMSPIREHSRKPDEMYDLIEKMYDGPYLEMFARQERPGWNSFGNQVTKFGIQSRSLFD